MVLKQPVKVIVIAIGFFIAACADVHASPLMNYPGTRATAMGTAFTAIADDASAIWYNPAGLSVGNIEDVDIVIEGGQTIDDGLDIIAKPFFALKRKGERFGWALSYFTPYSYGSFGVSDSHYNSGIVKQLDIWSLGLAYMFSSRLNVGGTIEIIDLQYKNNINDYCISGSLGTLLTPIVYPPWGFKLQVGGNYRFRSDIDELNYKGLNKPPSWNYGFAIMKSVTPIHSNFIISAQHETIDYSALIDYLWKFEMVSWGLEWQIALPEDAFCTRIALRAGMYKQTNNAKDIYFEMQGTTGGIGLRIGKKWGVEYALERRVWENRATGYNEVFTLHSAALTYSHNF